MKSTENFEVFSCVQSGAKTGAEHTGVTAKSSGVGRSMRLF